MNVDLLFNGDLKTGSRVTTAKYFRRPVIPLVNRCLQACIAYVLVWSKRDSAKLRASVCASLQRMAFYETAQLSMCDPHKEVWMGLRSPLSIFQTHIHTGEHTKVLSSHGACVPVDGIFQAESGTEDTSQFVLEVSFEVSGQTITEGGHFLTCYIERHAHTLKSLIHLSGEPFKL